MKRLIATPEGAGEQGPTRAFQTILANLVTRNTRAHEYTEANRFMRHAGQTTPNRDFVRRAIACAYMGGIDGAHDNWHAVY